MMIRNTAFKRTLAFFFLAVLAVEILLPVAAKALTSGPAQPEMKQFQPAGMSDMVDLFTGDFKYNIPLVDIDGYPVNLNYAQGAGMDDEASWVGLGWNLNVGAINRQLRGIPDDHNGDRVETEDYMKPKVTTGGKFVGRVEVAGMNAFKVGGSMTMGVFYDNYTGYGAEFGLGGNVGLSLTGNNANKQTMGMRAGLNGGFTSNTANGVSSSLGISLSSTKEWSDASSGTITGSLGIGHNTREGLKDLTLGTSYSITANTENDKTQSKVFAQGDGEVFYYSSTSSVAYGSASMSFNTPAFYPAGKIPFRSSNRTFSADFGGDIYIVNISGGMTGYKSVREVLRPVTQNYAYGSLYADKGKDNPGALLDFMREKDNIVVKDMNHIALPIATPDIFSYTSQAGGGQFRVNNGGSGVFNDNFKEDVSDNKTIGTDYGWGAYFHGGITYYDQDVQDRTGKWRNGNSAFLTAGDYPAHMPKDEEVTYFKSVGESTIEDPAFVNRIQDEKAVRIPLQKKNTTNQLKAEGENPMAPDNGQYVKNGRQVRNNAIMHLTATQAGFAGLDKRIMSYPRNVLNSENKFVPPPCAPAAAGATPIERVSGVRKGHHISEISIQGNDGKRMIYGIPVYNNRQEEYTFAANPDVVPAVNAADNLIPYTYDLTTKKPVHKFIKPTDEYYHKEIQPGYASSYLLTGILSPDYVDLKNDGITGDDRGTAVKFNYTRHTANFKWRTPFPEKMATLNRGLLADDEDDKASFVYGEKELWYIHSIETKTKIAYFITSERQDGLGVKDVHGGKGDNIKQLKLDEIRVYSKSNMTDPIVTVKLEYDYSLCKNIPNQVTPSPTAGKLTLLKVYFLYGSSGKGVNHPYKFTYNTAKINGTGDVAYTYLSTDRWGTYKAPGGNPGGMQNDEYPYSVNTSPEVFNLKEITLPTGAKIEVEYEPDDYSYVQDRQAMAMQPFPTLLTGAGTTTTSFYDMRKLRFNKPVGVTDLKSFKDYFLNGSSYIYGKVYVNLSDEPSSTAKARFDWVPCYAEIQAVTVNGNFLDVELTSIQVGGDRVSPFIEAAWQRMRLDYPKYAFPGYKNKIPDTEPLDAAIKALGSAIGNISEFWENFNERASRKKFARTVDWTKSFIRVAVQNKKGGGARVKTLKTRESWESGPEEVSIQQYTYTTKGPQDTYISSGVAAYEPSLGGDENPFRLPEPYMQKNRMALSNKFFLEEPFGEALFPAPVVGYSEVRIESRSGRDAAGVISQMGYLVNEYYTAKDFPTEVSSTGLEKYERKPLAIAQSFGGRSTYELVLSQGYAIRVNDMHGKAKAERVFNQAGKEIASTEYFYNAEENGGSMRLKNKVDVVDEKGVITRDQIMAREIDLVADMREAETSNTGLSINLGVDVVPFAALTVPIPHAPVAANNEYRLFRSASVTKLIQYFGFATKIVKKVDGATVTTNHLLYDKLTGIPVVSSSQNEFEDPVYSMNIPAYWMYGRMGHAYRNMNMLLEDFSVDEAGNVNPNYIPYLIPGDELTGLDRYYRLWVISSPNSMNSTPNIRVVDENGTLVKSLKGPYKVTRSGNRNQLMASTVSIVSLEKPFDNNRLKISKGQVFESLQVLDSKAVLFDEKWGQPIPCNTGACPEGYFLSKDAARCLLPATEMPDGGGLRIVEINDPNRNGYGKKAVFYNENDVSIGERETGFWQGKDGPPYGGRFYKSGIWVQETAVSKWYRVVHTVYASRDGDYAIGFAADEAMKLYINGALVRDLSAYAVTNIEWWRVKKIHLNKGANQLKLEFMNTTEGFMVGAEIYDNTMDELMNAPAADIRPIFNTRQLPGDNTVNVYEFNVSNNSIIRSRFVGPDGSFAQSDDVRPYVSPLNVGDCPPGYTKSADGQSCTKPIVSDGTLTLRNNLVERPEYSMNGAVFRDGEGDTNVPVIGCYWGGGSCSTSQSAAAKTSVVAPMFASGWCGRLNNAGVWLTNTSDLYAGGKLGIRSCFTVPASGYYYIGYGCTRELDVKIDGTAVAHLSASGTGLFDPMRTWTIRKVYLSEGKHEIDILGGIMDVHSSIGVDIYNTPRANLAVCNPTPTLIFSTGNLPNSGAVYDIYIHNPSGTLVKKKLSCGPGTTGFADICNPCSLDMNSILNPYYTGYLGNWLPSQDKTYLTERKETPLSTKTSFIRKGGTYKAFSPFWQYDETAQQWVQSADINWVTGRWITLYDSYSQELENKDALKRFSGTRFGYKESLPLIVGGNARSRELFFDSFEDYSYNFNAACDPAQICRMDGFDIHKIVGSNQAAWLNADESHTGNYSLRLNGAVTLKTNAFNYDHAPGGYLGNNKDGEYVRSREPWRGLFGFSPMRDRKYVISMWVKDAAPTGSNVAVVLNVNNTAVTLQRKATVEGWKLAEYVLDMTPLALADMGALEIKLIGSGVLVDDIRIFPYDGQAASYVYDERTLRLMAELDANNFATLYEYDDEGSLVRVKKETERGIITIKESRSTYRKN